MCRWLITIWKKQKKRTQTFAHLRVQLGSSWRREQDLNLRYLSVYPLSKRAHSTALTSLHSRWTIITDTARFVQRFAKISQSSLFSRFVRGKIPFERIKTRRRRKRSRRGLRFNSAEAVSARSNCRSAAGVSVAIFCGT